MSGDIINLPVAKNICCRCSHNAAAVFLPHSETEHLKCDSGQIHAQYTGKRIKLRERLSWKKHTEEGYGITDNIIMESVCYVTPFTYVKIPVGYDKALTFKQISKNITKVFGIIDHRLVMLYPAVSIPYKRNAAKDKWQKNKKRCDQKYKCITKKKNAFFSCRIKCLAQRICHEFHLLSVPFVLYEKYFIKHFIDTV